MHGIDGMRLMTTGSMFEAVALSAASRRSAELMQERDEQLAEMITEKIVKAWNRGQH